MRSTRWRELLGRVRRSGPAGDDVEPSPVLGRRPPERVVDGNTRTFWSRGALAPSTLIEVEPLGTERISASRRVSALLAAHDRGDSARPRANPAFSEALFVELMRAEQYDRAFALLAPECRRRWGRVAAFAEAHRGGSMTRLLGVDVVAVRDLETWRDPDTGITHDNVAELDVEYLLAGGADATMNLARTVHLVACDGKWASLSYPADRTAPAR